MGAEGGRKLSWHHSAAGDVGAGGGGWAGSPPPDRWIGCRLAVHDACVADGIQRVLCVLTAHQYSAADGISDRCHGFQRMVQRVKLQRSESVAQCGVLSVSSAS